MVEDWEKWAVSKVISLTSQFNALQAFFILGVRGRERAREREREGEREKERQREIEKKKKNVHFSVLSFFFK